MDAFDQQLKQRLPLVCATLELFDFAFDELLLAGLYEQHRGRCYEDVLSFPRLVSLVRDCLLQHKGSGHRLFQELERDHRQPVDESNFYRKLSRMPVEASRALLQRCTMRLIQVAATPLAVLLPGCFEGFEAVVIDGKKIKNAAGRLKPTRGYSGALLGAKALVALSVRSGLALAMSDSLDGEANDLALIDELLPQVRAGIDRPILWLADRQFGTGASVRQLRQRSGDRFVVRIKESLVFQGQTRRELQDDQQRKVIDEIGSFGSGPRAMTLLRRVTLVRGPGEENVVLLTDLVDQKQFDALDLLKLYRRRWGIENMFQQVTETFGLEHLIGCSPKAILFQFAFCLLMYNLIQVLKGYVAEDGKVQVSIVSTYGLFYDVRRELSTWAYLCGEARPLLETRAGRNADAMRQRLAELTRDSWDAVAYTKASDKKPRKKKPPAKALHGGHTSVQRLLNGTARVKS